MNQKRGIRLDAPFFVADNDYLRSLSLLSLSLWLSGVVTFHTFFSLVSLGGRTAR
jgi:hypothetical protein